jgi:putative autoinducer-2 (AI-2) aldolase
MEWGLQNRLSRILNPKTGRAVMLAVDHGYFQGPTSGLQKPGETIKPLIPYADTLMLTRGVLRNCIDPGLNKAIVLRVSGGTSVLSELSNEGIMTSVEEAIRLNVSAITLSIFVGGEYERQTLLALGELVNQGNKYGIPVLAVTAVGREMARDARYLGLASRIAAELGAHFVKTYYCDDFEKVVEGCPVPIVIAGGKKIPERDALQMAYNAVSIGAAGVDMGRNIFQSDSPVGMIKAVRNIIHKKASVEEAYEVYAKEKEKKAVLV